MLDESWTGTPSLGILVFECISVNAAHRDVIAEVTVGPGFATIVRGPAELDPATFSLDDYLTEPSRALISRMLAAWPGEMERG